jgi:Flp pilus assembly protein TadD
LLQADDLRPNDPFILQKIARQYSDETLDTADPAAQKRLCQQALDYARRASKLAPDNAVCTLSLAICYGKLGLHSELDTRIKYARLVKHYAELAIKQDPKYAWAYHVLGRWHLEVAKLGATKRFLVGLVYGALPEASTAKAVALLQHAVALDPQNPDHQIDLGFACLANDQPQQAQAAFTAGLALPSTQKQDAAIKHRARAALAEITPSHQG